MPKRPKFKSTDRDINAVVKSIFQESPKAAVIVLTAELDLALRDILEEYFLPQNSISRKYGASLFGPDEPAGTFSARIELAFRLGLIPEWCQEELHIIRRIRNEISHGVVELSFKDSPIREFISQLKVPGKLKEKHRQTLIDENWKRFWEDAKQIIIFSGSVVLAELQVTYLRVRDGIYPRPEQCLRKWDVVNSKDEA